MTEIAETAMLLGVRGQVRESEEQGGSFSILLRTRPCHGSILITPGQIPAKVQGFFAAWDRSSSECHLPKAEPRPKTN